MYFTSDGQALSIYASDNIVEKIVACTLFSSFSSNCETKSDLSTSTATNDTSALIEKSNKRRQRTNSDMVTMMDLLLDDSNNTNDQTMDSKMNRKSVVEHFDKLLLFAASCSCGNLSIINQRYYCIMIIYGVYYYTIVVLWWCMHHLSSYALRCYSTNTLLLNNIA